MDDYLPARRNGQSTDLEYSISHPEPSRRRVDSRNAHTTHLGWIG